MESLDWALRQLAANRCFLGEVVPLENIYPLISVPVDQLLQDSPRLTRCCSVSADLYRRERHEGLLEERRLSSPRRRRRESSPRMVSFMNGRLKSRRVRLPFMRLRAADKARPRQLSGCSYRVDNAGGVRKGPGTSW